MPAVPTMKADFCCLGGSERHASAITTALSPLSTTLITAILTSAVHISGSLSAAHMPCSVFEVVGAHKVPARNYRLLSRELRAAVRSLTRDCRETYARLTGASGKETVKVLPTPSVSSSREMSA